MTLIEVHQLTAERFAPYGSIFKRGDEAPLAETPAFSYWNDLARFHIEGEVEVGWCDVHARPDTVDWFERHDRTPEILIPVDGTMALPVMTGAGRVESFLVEPGEAVVIAPGTWHSACIPVGAESVGYFVIFRRGTPAEDVVKTAVEPFRVQTETIPGPDR
jgi:ureidoglycolate hydrolase